MAVLTTARAKQLAWPALSGSSQDTLIDLYVDQAEAWVAEYIGLPAYDSATLRSLAVQTYTLYPDGDGGPVLELGVQPVATVTSIHVSIARDYDTEALVDSGDYALLGNTGQVVLNYDADRAAWPRHDRSIKAIVTAGFAALDAPMETAVALLARAWFDDGQRKMTGISSKSGKAGSTQYEPRDIPRVVLQALSGYQHPAAMIG